MINKIIQIIYATIRHGSLHGAHASAFDVHDTVCCNLQSGRTAIFNSIWSRDCRPPHKKLINGVQQRVPCSSFHAKANEIDFCDQALAMDPESLKLLSDGPVWLIRLFVCDILRILQCSFIICIYSYSYPHFNCTTAPI